MSFDPTATVADTMTGFEARVTTVEGLVATKNTTIGTLTQQLGTANATIADLRSQLAGTMPTPQVSLAALALSTTALTSGTAVTIAITGTTDGSTITGTPPDGMTLDSAAREISGTPTTAGDYGLVLTETLAGAVNSPRQTTIDVTVAAAPVVTPTPTLTGFYANGSTNPKLLAALQGVKASTRRGKIVVKADSVLGYGEGGGTSGTNLIVNARPGRMAARVAANLSALGLRTLDNAIVGDNGASRNSSGITLHDYDPRVTMGPWTVTEFANESWAGGGLLNNASPGNSGSLFFNPPGSWDRAELVFYASSTGNPYFVINTQFPTVGPSNIQLANTGGFTDVTVGITTPGVFNLEVSDSNGLSALRSIRVWNSTQPAIDFLVHGVRVALASDQAAIESTKHWYNNDALAFDAPDLAIIGVGLNDRYQNVAPSATVAAIQTMVTTARLSGDALIVLPLPSGGSFANGEVAQNNAVKAYAAANNVALLSLYEYKNGVFDASAFTDGQAHPTPATYADVSTAITSALKLMAPTAFS